MRVMILTKQDVEELDVINESNAHLNKKLAPGKLKSGENYLKTEILKDAKNWGPWLQLLGKLKVTYVLDQELLVDWNFAKK